MSTELSARQTCFACGRPRATCHCDEIVRVENQTPVLLLQHRRERRHPFNSARLLERALTQIETRIGYAPDFAGSPLPFQPGAALLYPSQNAPLLTDPSVPRPAQLVIVDGTWHHAKALLRDVPALRGLPRFRLAPSEPGRYRIRREPSPDSMSTLEATVQALRLLEPATPGLDRLLKAFDVMVQRQLVHARPHQNWRRKTRRSRGGPRMPAAFRQDPNRLVVAYGEAAPRRQSRDPQRVPCVWAAERLGTRARFVALIKPEVPVTGAMLDHLALRSSDFAAALPLTEFHEAWKQFLHPDDTLLVYHPATVKLLDGDASSVPPTLHLKSICANLERTTYPSLEALLQAYELPIPASAGLSRCEKRLNDAVQLSQYLRQLAADRIPPTLDRRPAPTPRLATEPER
ncbi:MAG: tRNA-uridine aminocarboxypropyltransferase [Planctomycetota bacterium]